MDRRSTRHAHLRLTDPAATDSIAGPGRAGPEGPRSPSGPVRTPLIFVEVLARAVEPDRQREHDFDIPDVPSRAGMACGELPVHIADPVLSPLSSLHVSHPDACPDGSRQKRPVENSRR